MWKSVRGMLVELRRGKERRRERRERRKREKKEKERGK